MRKVYEVTGYTQDGSTFCADHKPDEPDGTIFLGDEWESAPACETCFSEVMEARANPKPGVLRLEIEDALIDVTVIGR
jgi:hypothetical protein